MSCCKLRSLRVGLALFLNLVLFALVGCDSAGLSKFLPSSGSKAEGQGAGAPGTGSTALTPKSDTTIRIASFNIQVFGTTKARDSEVMNVLTSVVREFDVVAIQELRTTDPAVMDDFVRRINQSGDEYHYVVGPRLGRTTSKEQYAFVFDSRRLELIPQTVVTIEDPQDLLHREPLIGLFRTRTQGQQPPFSFVLVNIHTDPDETKQELDALGEVFVAVQQNPWREDDVILLGDLNVDYKKLGRLGQLPDIGYTIQGEMTNTRGTEAYDNIVFNRVATTEFTGQAGVVDLQKTFGLTMDQALRVSDHCPIWAEFQIVEGGAPALFAARPSLGVGANGAAPPQAMPGQMVPGQATQGQVVPGRPAPGYGAQPGAVGAPPGYFDRALQQSRQRR